MKRILILITLIVVYTQIAFSQKTGNFTDSVMFNGQYRILACHVPA